MEPDSPISNRTILLIEPDRRLLPQTERLLLQSGYRVLVDDGGRRLPDRATLRSCDAILIALDARGIASPEGLRSLRRLAGPTPVLVLCSADRVQEGAETLQHGIDDYLLRPPDSGELGARLARLLDRSDLDSRLAFFQQELAKRSVSKNLEARSPGMRAALDRVRRVAPMRSTVLILGESGVGKELIARSVHFDSPRRDGPFIALNCAAISPSLIESELFGHEKGSFTGAHARVRGKFEIAHRGTLFLDEIAEMDPATQAKLLRVLEEREFMRIGGGQSVRVDVRVIAATNADLAGAVSAGRFRQDLYYRLKVVTIEVPPLRERRLDIPRLVEIFLLELARANAVPPKRMTPEALAALEGYDWPGNVRELKNLLESLLVASPGEEIRLEDLPRAMKEESAPRMMGGLAPGASLAEMERELIRVTLEHTGGNRTHSAALLGIGVRTLQRKMRAYGLAIASTRRRPRSRKTSAGGE